MSFSETIFLFFLALIIFGPKKLPEMARQAGRLLAELRRASNEFKSQIETEISHLEVQKLESQKNEAQKSLTGVATGTAPQGTVASMSLNPSGSETNPATPEPSVTLAAPTADSTAPVSTSAQDSTSTPEAIAAVGDPASQASHV